MTAKLVDDITDTHSNKTREAIGQTMINVKTAGTRLSTFLAGVFLLVLCLALGPVGRAPGRGHRGHRSRRRPGRLRRHRRAVLRLQQRSRLPV